MPAVFDDLRVLDLSSGPTGGVATMVLADFGADVVKVERPGGDPMRGQAAAPMWLRGKRSIELDLRDEGARAQLVRLAEGADVVVASFRPGNAEALGADYATLSAANPGLVYCSITGWGPRGELAHYAPYEGVVAAKSGRMFSFVGQPQREGPAFAAVQVGVHAAAQAALSGIVAALLARERDGRGQLVETSLLQGMVPYDLAGLLRVQMEQRYPQGFEGDPYGKFTIMPTLQYHPVMGSDGRWMQMGNILEHLFHAFMAEIGLAHVYGEERFAGAPANLEAGAREELRDMILQRMQERTIDEWMTQFRKSGQVASEPVQSAQDALDHPDMVANGEVIAFDHPRLGATRQIGPLAILTETPGEIPLWSPEVGEHTAEVLAELAAAADHPGAGAAGNGTDGTANAPLAGITVLDFSTIIAAPLGAAFLADLGARVIKIEQLEGDSYRGMGYGMGSYLGVAKTTAGKEVICLDLKQERGREVIRGLIAKADAIVHNFRPGVPERLGIGFEDARAIRPDIVYLQLNGYGPKGESHARPSAHPIPGAAMGGQLWQAGAAVPPAEARTLEEVRETSRWLYRANEANPDPNTSCVVQNAVLLGLYARKRLGVGQRIYLSMLAANAYANSDDFLSYEGKAPRPLVDAQLHGVAATYRLYPARAGWVFLGIGTEREWSRFCELSGRNDLASDPRFASAEARMEHDDVLVDELAALFGERDAPDWEALLAPEGVGCVEADGTAVGPFFASSPQIPANGWDVEADHAFLGHYRRHAPMVTFSRTPGRYGPGALAGEHTDALLDELGYDAAAMVELREQRVVASEPVYDPATYRPPGL